MADISYRLATNKNMDIRDYKREIKRDNFEEFPLAINFYRPLSSIVPYDKATPALKIYLCKLIMCRNFTPTSGDIVFPEDLYWFINEFRKEYQTDLVKPWLTPAIKEAISQILSEDVFGKNITGTTFMFGVVEFYAKYELGFRPLHYNFFDKRKKDYKDYYKGHFKRQGKKVPFDLSISSAFEILQKEMTRFRISKCLNQIDENNKQQILKMGIKEGKWITPKISDRLSIARNTMLHGENHTFYNIGAFLIMLYILFHFHRTG